jgi:hypothetical protein
MAKFGSTVSLEPPNILVPIFHSLVRNQQPCGGPLSTGKVPHVSHGERKISVQAKHLFTFRLFRSSLTSCSVAVKRIPLEQSRASASGGMSVLNFF